MGAIRGTVGEAALVQLFELAGCASRPLATVRAAMHLMGLAIEGTNDGRIDLENLV